MSMRVLVVFATMYGSTQEVAEAVARALGDEGAETSIAHARDVRSLAGYEAVVLGAPLISHHLHKDVRSFLSRHREALSGLAVAVFALGPVHDDENEWAECRGQFEAELEKSAWLEPVATQLFGGRFDPALLRFPFNKLAGSAGASDVRDWEAIHAWAAGLPALLERRAAVS